ncbi:MAG: hypothetical protein LQ340_004624 [Diploschistes diacapsis]|nr:MAG: hypothetical protein LQ340_004624 [Diploschistes diacapsis]
MGAPERPPANGFVRVARKVYNPIGFKKGYNFILFFIFNGALFGFTLARLEYLSIWGVFCNASSAPQGVNGAAPGECYWYANFPTLKAGITLHLSCVLPAALLAVFQFVPIIRYKIMIWHRVAGHLIILLLLCGLVGALMIANHAFGGDFAVQTWVGATSIMVVFSMSMAYANIKRLQIDQHRAWMLRTWFYLGTIITLRLIMIIGAQILAAWPAHEQYTAVPCAEIQWMYGGSAAYTVSQYPMCANSSTATSINPSAYALVLGNMNTGDPTMVAVGMGQLFGPSGWLALFLHAVGVEMYLRLTPRENERLKRVSYERQLERGFKHPGAAGLTPERLGDSDPYVLREEAAAKRHGAVRWGSSGSEAGREPVMEISAPRLK